MTLYFYKLINVELNLNTALYLSLVMLYVNLFRPIILFPYLSLIIDFSAIVLIVKHIFSNKIKKNALPFLFLLTLFIFVSFIEMFNPNIPSLSAGLEGFRKTSFPFIMFYIGFFSIDKKIELPLFLHRFSIATFPILLYAIKQYFFFSDFDKLYLGANNADLYTGMIFGQLRSTSFFAGSFHLGLFSAIMALINIFLFETTKQRNMKHIYIVFFIVAIVSTYTSLTRTNFIALFFGILVYKIFQMKKKNLIVVFPFVLISSIALGSFIIKISNSLLTLNNPILKMIGSIGNFLNDSRFLGRINGWKNIISLVSSNPLSGYGTGSAGDTLQYSYNFNYHVTSHNFFLKILMETGVVGFLLISMFFILILLKLIRNNLNSCNLMSQKFSALIIGILTLFVINAAVGSAIESIPISNLVMMFLGMGVNFFNKGFK